MVIVQEGIKYMLATSSKNKPESVSIVFCHRDTNGFFQEGITSEELLKCLISRHTCLVNKDNSTENITTLLHLKEALTSIKNRRDKKMIKIKNNEYSRNDIPVQTTGTED